MRFRGLGFRGLGFRVQRLQVLESSGFLSTGVLFNGLMGLSSQGYEQGTHRPLSSSFWGLPYRILNIDHKKELLRGLWVTISVVLKAPIKIYHNRAS